VKKKRIFVSIISILCLSLWAINMASAASFSSMSRQDSLYGTWSYHDQIKLSILPLQITKEYFLGRKYIYKGCEVKDSGVENHFLELPLEDGKVLHFKLSYTPSDVGTEDISVFVLKNDQYQRVGFINMHEKLKSPQASEMYGIWQVDHGRDREDIGNALQITPEEFCGKKYSVKKVYKDITENTHIVISVKDFLWFSKNYEIQVLNGNSPDIKDGRWQIVVTSEKEEKASWVELYTGHYLRHQL